MRPTSPFPSESGPLAMASMLAAVSEVDRHRGETRRHEHHRGLAEVRGASPSVLSRLETAIRRVLGLDLSPIGPASEHALTDYPCRLPDGRMGRVAVIPQGGDWGMDCRLA